MNRKMCFLIIIALILISNTYALGVTPAKKLFEYNEGSNIEGTFKIINDDAVARELVIGTRGELTKDIKLETRRVSVSSGDSEKIVSYSVTQPASLTPGRHTGEIVISEEIKKTGQDEGVVGAVLSVVTSIEIYVPYPGKYAEAKLIANNAGVGENVLLLIPILNLGEFDLETVYANIDIYSDLGEKIDSFNTKEISIASESKADLATNWKGSVSVGKYKAIATVIYDGESTTVEDTFQIGSASLILHQLTVNNFALGQIAKMDLLVENTWSEDFNDVYTQVKIFGNGNRVLANFNSPTETVTSLSKKVLSSYWDTAGVQEGTYDTTVIIHYEGSKTVETDLQLVVSQNSLEVIGLGYVLSEGDGGFNVSDNLVVILIIVIGILILLNLLWFFILRKNIKSKSNSRNN